MNTVHSITAQSLEGWDSRARDKPLPEPMMDQYMRLQCIYWRIYDDILSNAPLTPDIFVDVQILSKIIVKPQTFTHIYFTHM